jgi:predicted Zn-dependent protease
MADLAEASRLPGALLWRSRVVDLNPTSLTDRIALAQTAMAAHEMITASNALEGVSAADKQTAPFQNTAGAVAAASNHPQLAESYFMEAARLDPQNTVPQLNLAVVRLHSTNAQTLAEARGSLQQLSTNPTNSALRCSALRELAGDAIRAKQKEVALGLTQKLLQETNSLFSDKILFLSLLSANGSPEFKPELARLQIEAGNDATKSYELAYWQSTAESPAEALSWLKRQPMKIQTNQPVALFETECYTAVRDWRGLQSSLTNQYWGNVDFLRHAFLSRALSGQELAGSAAGEWQLAVKGAAAEKTSLGMLLNLAVQFKMDSEAEDLLWTIIKEYPDQKWAAQALTRDFAFYGRTSSLLALFRQELKANPSDSGAKNNLALTALLLDQPDVKPYDLAREVYEQSPTNSSYASTYAFALLLQKKNAQALKIMEQLTPQQLEDPSLSGYYGLVLQATGNRAKAKKYFDLASKAKLLPEEKALFEKASHGP